MHLAHRSVLTLVVTLTILVASVAAAQARSPVKVGATVVKVAASQILVTTKGLTVYAFALDKPNASACYATCAAFWPPLIIAKGTRPATTMSDAPGTFGTTTRKDGSH